MNFFAKNKEENLSRRLRNGDSHAMREFYALYGTYLTAVCLRYVPDEEDMRDIIQDSMIQIITHISAFTYRGEGSLRAWATKIVVSQSLRFLREKKQHERLVHDVELPDVQEEEDPPINGIPPDVIHRLVTELPTGYRTVFNLYVFEGMSHQEIAQLLGIKPDTSASQLCRAKNLLAKKIKQYQKLQKQL